MTKLRVGGGVGGERWWFKTAFFVYIIVQLVGLIGVDCVSRGSYKISNAGGGGAGGNVPVVPRHYKCDDSTHRCIQEDYGVTTGVGFAVCRLICDPNGSIWPMPSQSPTLAKTTAPIDLNNLQVHSANVPVAVQPLVRKALDFFLQVLNNTINNGGIGAVKPRRDHTRFPFDTSQGTPINIYITIQSDQTDLDINIDESYDLQINSNRTTCTVTIAAPTFFGMRHALETLSQLIAFDETNDTIVTLTSAHVVDQPVFTYRGLVLDTSRQFYPVESLESLIDGMSYNKLNFFHWHLTDTGSFSFESLALPIMTQEGAYSPSRVYSQANVKALVEYGRVRGVRVLPEIDAPAHAGNGWGWGPAAGMGNLAVCINSHPWVDYCIEPPCGQLNPTNPNLYRVLGTLYNEMYNVFEKPKLFHMGGDEVFFGCWNSSSEIVDWLANHQHGTTEDDFLWLWGQFQLQAYQMLKSNTDVTTTPILWTSNLVNNIATAQMYVPAADYIIQVWENSQTSTVVPDLLEAGYRIIVTNWDAWYLDCGVGGWVSSGSNWCSPYKEWQLMYENRPYRSLNNSWKITDPDQRRRILGGEVAMWSEEVDANGFGARVWPRAAAVAERLWSDPTAPWLEADDRMQFHRARLVSRGINADALQTLWCLFNQGQCTLPQEAVLQQKDNTSSANN